MKPLAAVLLIFFLSGCVLTLPSKKKGADLAATREASFAAGLKALEKRGDDAPLKKLAGDASGSDWSGYSRTVLNIYSGQQKRLQQLQRENGKLRSDLDKLNEINLELEKRTN